MTLPHTHTLPTHSNNITLWPSLPDNSSTHYAPCQCGQYLGQQSTTPYSHTNITLWPSLPDNSSTHYAPCQCGQYLGQQSTASTRRRQRDSLHWHLGHLRYALQYLLTPFSTCSHTSLTHPLTQLLTTRSSPLASWTSTVRPSVPAHTLQYLLTHLTNTPSSWTTYSNINLPSNSTTNSLSYLPSNPLSNSLPN